ncbi:butyrate kinase [Clostridium sediminicola]|uniref:butyrate kinase n=1 Tax=Clostridium sediminicola TaxID=3114879 RepID=UPI0031F218F5
MKEQLKILAINPGSTSTKIAVYSEKTVLFVETINHSEKELNNFETVQEQFLMRKDAVLKVLEDNNFNIKDLAAIVGRGGILPPVKSGAYVVNDLMVDRLKNRPLVEHASNLGAIIAYEISNNLGIPSYIYDSVAVDEMEDIARISGMPEIERISLSHALNMRAVAIKTAEKIGKLYTKSNFIVAHLGGGISISVHERGKMVDIVSDDEGPFSPERAGRVPCRKLIELCYSGKYDKRTMQKKLRGNGGIKSYLGTHSTLEVEEKINAGDDKAVLIYEAMAYQVSKGIGELATVVNGMVDRIIITGGIAHSQMMTEWIKSRVEFIAPVEIMAGENELESLALGTLRVLNGEEEAREYIEQ